MSEKPTRVTVLLTATSVQRVARLATKYHDNKTNTINRAIALYDMLDEHASAGVFMRNADGELERLVLL